MLSVIAASGAMRRSAVVSSVPVESSAWDFGKVVALSNVAELIDRPAPAGPSARGRLLFVVNDLGFFLSHRLPIAEAAAGDGWEVHIAAPPDPEAAPVLEEAGFRLHRFGLDRHGTNPVVEAVSLGALYRLFRRVGPDIVHLVTIKPVVYGGVAARLAGVPCVVSAVSGLGYVFSERTARARAIARAVRPLYRAALGHPRQRVIFQNAYDRDALAALGAGLEGRTEMIGGAGVCLESFTPTPEPQGPVTVMLPARLLREKGIAEFVAAAERLRAEGLEARFVVVGEAPGGNPSRVPDGVLERWRASGAVELWGRRDDMPAVLAQAHVVVLPSYYREGLPKVLLEAAACGRPVITTDWPGCRDAVRPGETGLLVPPRDAEALAGAIRRLATDAVARRRMGRAGRALAEEAFCARAVAARHLEIYEALGSDPEG